MQGRGARGEQSEQRKPGGQQSLTTFCGLLQDMSCLLPHIHKLLASPLALGEGRGSDRPVQGWRCDGPGWADGGRLRRWFHASVSVRMGHSRSAPSIGAISSYSRSQAPLPYWPDQPLAPDEHPSANPGRSRMSVDPAAGEANHGRAVCGCAHPLQCTADAQVSQWRC